MPTSEKPNLTLTLTLTLTLALTLTLTRHAFRTSQRADEREAEAERLRRGGALHAVREVGDLVEDVARRVLDPLPTRTRVKGQ